MNARIMITPGNFNLTQAEFADRMLFIVDTETRQIVYANAMAHQKLGYASSELVGMKISDLHPLEMDEIAIFLSDVFANKEASTDSLHCMAKNGTVIPSSITARIEPYSGREYLIAKVTLRD